MTAQFQSSITEWVGLPLSKVENLKVGNEFVGYLEDHDEFHLRQLWDIHGKMFQSNGPGVQDRFEGRSQGKR